MPTDKNKLGEVFKIIKSTDSTTLRKIAELIPKVIEELDSEAAQIDTDPKINLSISRSCSEKVCEDKNVKINSQSQDDCSNGINILSINKTCSEVANETKSMDVIQEKKVDLGTKAFNQLPLIGSSFETDEKTIDSEWDDKKLSHIVPKSTGRPFQAKLADDVI